MAATIWELDAGYPESIKDSWIKDMFDVIVDMSSVGRTFTPDIFVHQCCQRSLHIFFVMRCIKDSWIKEMFDVIVDMSMRRENFYTRFFFLHHQHTNPTPEEADADSVTCPISLMSFSTRFFTDISLSSLTPRFKYLQQSLTEGLPRWEVLWFMESISPSNHDSRVSGCCRRSSARTWLIYLEHRPELPAEADAESTSCPISLMNFSTRFIFNVFSVSLPFFSETAMFKCLHTSLAEGLPSWELPSCKVSISAFNHASRASERWRCSSARTWLIYLEIIDDPAEAAEAEEAMASKENRIHTKTSTWISPKRWWVSLTMSCRS